MAGRSRVGTVWGRHSGAPVTEPCAPGRERGSRHRASWVDWGSGRRQSQDWRRPMAWLGRGQEWVCGGGGGLKWGVAGERAGMAGSPGRSGGGRESLGCPGRGPG